MAMHTIPEDQSKYGNFDSLDERLQNSIKKLLNEPSKESDSHSVVYASYLLKAWTDYGTVCIVWK